MPLNLVLMVIFMIIKHDLRTIRSQEKVEPLDQY